MADLAKKRLSNNYGIVREEPGELRAGRRAVQVGCAMGGPAPTALVIRGGEAISETRSPETRLMGEVVE